VYGPLPSFLPSSSLAPNGALTDSVLTGTAAHPALTTEGDAVRVLLGNDSVLMTVTGPQVPGEGMPYQAPATTCTWTVTITSASRAIPVRVADFTTLDHLGDVQHPALVPGQKIPAGVLAPGHSESFELRAFLNTGEGLIRWAPQAGTVLASWDFEVEND
jgi:hypothetical protein